MRKTDIQKLKELEFCKHEKNRQKIELHESQK